MNDAKTQAHAPNERPVPAPRYWSSLDELARSPEFERWASAEFPTAWEEAKGSDVGRRDFLKLMGASLSLSGLTAACVRQPEEVIVPYVKQPEELVPGKPVHFATAFPQGGYALGLLIETHMFRPTHVAGNPDHAESGGGVSVQAQASVLDVWDPDRSRRLLRNGKTSSWPKFSEAMEALRAELAATNGAGLRILTQPTTSPTLAAQIDALRLRYPAARWHQYAACSRQAMYEGTRRAYGRPLEVSYRLTDARAVLAVDADFMGTMPGSVRHQRELMGQRNDPGSDWARLYVAEPMPTSAGSVADHRVRMRPDQGLALLAEVARELGLSGPRGNSGLDTAFVRHVAADLRAAGSRAAVLVGDGQPAEAHALALAINQRLGSIGTTVRLNDPVVHEPEDPGASLAALTADLEAGAVEAIIVLGANPVYDAPGDVAFLDGYQKARLRIHVGSHVDETAEWSHWHVPLSHYLETWSDLRGPDGTVSVVQPTMQPLHGSKSMHEVLAVLLDDARSDHARLRDHWRRQLGATDFERRWRRALHDGVLVGTEFPSLRPALSAEATNAEAVSVSGLQVRFAPDANLFDGRFANNAWLMELPRPITRTCWDNAAFVSPATAGRLGIDNEDVVELKVQGRTARLPAWILPGHADDVVTVHLGWGRTRAGSVGSDCGVNVAILRSAAGMDVAPVSLEKTEGQVHVACVQDHFRMEDRALVREATRAEFEAHPDFAHAREAHMPKLTLWEPYQYKGYKWGMTINLSSCTGCNACMVACQSENNIAVVGKREVLNGREMHWIRLDRYFEGSVDEPRIAHQPVNCLMCENAPCETVCPVNATVHGPQGLNQMVYNRCVGTRYCSNNCPYKVRRFNFRLYTDWDSETRKGQRNPDVTVRGRGVMEKCTYCVQRINRARIQYTVDGQERLPTDAVKTACQEACPSGAIVFGDLNDEASAVAKLASTKLNYALLSELNTKPRTTYLARLTNPHPDLAPASTAKPEAPAHEH